MVIASAILHVLYMYLIPEEVGVHNLIAAVADDFAVNPLEQIFQLLPGRGRREGREGGEGEEIEDVALDSHLN